MHRCLHIQEIVQHVADCEEWGLYKVNLALTCRAFYEPATSLRWRKLRRLEPLVLLLPWRKSAWWEEAMFSMMVGLCLNVIRDEIVWDF